MNSANTVSVADVALVGLGEVGGRFLEEMLRVRHRGINIACAAQLSETPGKRMAREAGIPLVTVDEIVALGDTIDVIFDLSGNPEVRKELRAKMRVTGNIHTIIAPEIVARIMWAVMTEEHLADIHDDKGY